MGADEDVTDVADGSVSSTNSTRIALAAAKMPINFIIPYAPGVFSGMQSAGKPCTTTDPVLIPVYGIWLLGLPRASAAITQTHAP